MALNNPGHGHGDRGGHHPHGHGHGHGEDGWDFGSPVHTLLSIVVAALAIATLVGLAIWWPRGEAKVDQEQLGFSDRLDATVTDAEHVPCSYDPSAGCTALIIEITEGDDKGQTVPLEFGRAENTTASKLREGAKIVLDDAGPGLPPEERYSFTDVQRGSSLWVLVFVFAGSVVALGRLRGLLALVGIAISLAILLLYVFPALLQGVAPVPVALTASSVIGFATFYLAHGVNPRTTVALLGTMTSLILTAVLAGVFASGARLSGLAAQESLILLNFAPDLDFQGMLMAAVIIGTLGVLDDVTITQVSAVSELHRSDPQASARQLYSSGIRIGRDHIASAVNTLVLAYSAAALPLLLLFTQSGLGLGDLLVTETVAVEVVQTLVGSIGLVASVPLTTALACWVVTQDRPTARDQPPDNDFDRYFGVDPWPG